MLEEAIAEKEDAAKWTHPEEAIDKLSRILNQQIGNDDNTDIIEMTQDLILDAEDSLRMINQGQEEAIFYQLIETDESPKDFNLNDSVIQEISNLDDESIDMLPPIEHQDTYEVFSQEINEHDQKQLEISNQSTSSNESKMSIDEGQKTPVSGSKKSPPINIIQNQLNEALKILSPKEKLAKMRRQAKLNAATKQSKLNQLWKSNASKSTNKIAINDKADTTKKSTEDQMQKGKITSSTCTTTGNEKKDSKKMIKRMIRRMNQLH